MYIASDRGHANIVNILIENKANVNQPNNVRIILILLFELIIIPAFILIISE